MSTKKWISVCKWSHSNKIRFELCPFDQSEKRETIKKQKYHKDWRFLSGWRSVANTIVVVWVWFVIKHDFDLVTVVSDPLSSRRLRHRRLFPSSILKLTNKIAIINKWHTRLKMVSTIRKQCLSAFVLRCNYFLISPLPSF